VPVQGQELQWVGHIGIIQVLAALSCCLPYWQARRLLAQQNYPSRQIKVVVPFLAGGAVDVVVRLVFNKISERWNQVIVVENRPGAGGNLGADMVAKSEPDGYTLLATPPSVLVINQYLYDKMPFDPAEAFAPISLIGILPNVLVVGPSVKATTLREWIDEAKQQPDKFSYASQGVGTTGHLTGAMLNVAAGLALRHIPYRGFPPALADMISGRIDAMFIDTGNALPRVGKDNLRALGVSTEERIGALLPDVLESVRTRRLLHASALNLHVCAARERAHRRAEAQLPLAVHVNELLDLLIGVLAAEVSGPTRAALADAGARAVTNPSA